MTMDSQAIISLFDKYSLVIPHKLKWYEERTPNQRSMVISDPNNTFIITFSEGMAMMDMRENMDESNRTVSYQCCKDGKYINMKRSTADSSSCAYFHMELEDDNGSILYLPGKMVITSDYKWSDEIEPVLIKLMDGIAICKVKGGG